ncbi:TIGR03086 family metal-binding protein [Actinopolymorpha sp. B9G3]|uniref:TIGR03086 family metal-binding protein n=1 Tax=Actinopolymorpha sp. B9G3 TaxID=3158970 RepID=UPI0032D8F9F2
MSIPDLRAEHRRAAEATIEVVSRLTHDDLSRPTPCADWNLGDLLAHMIVQNHGFAAAAEGGGADPAIWKVGPLGADPMADHTAATEHVMTAFAADGVLDQPFFLAELTDQPLPATQAISFHFVDCVVHGWDVARSVGQPWKLDADLLHAALPVAEAVPDSDFRTLPGASFRPRLPSTPADDPLDRILRLLGRSPAWPGEAPTPGL